MNRAVSPPRADRAFAQWLVRRRNHLLLLATACGGWALLATPQLALDRSIERMFAPHDSLLPAYAQLKRTFGNHDFLIAAYAEPELTSDAGMQRVGDLARQIREIPGVVATVSLPEIPGAADWSDTTRGAALRRIFSSYTHNDALDAAGVLCLIDRPDGTTSSTATPDQRSQRQTLAAVKAAVASYPKGVVVGEPLLLAEAFDLLERDGRRLNTWCTALVLITLVIALGNWRWLILPLVVVQLTMGATRCAIWMCALEQTLVSSMLSAIVTVIAVATVAHVIVRFRDQLLAGMPPVPAMEATLSWLAKPIALACLTDAVGFAALLVSAVGPVRDFGMMMSIGAILVWPFALAVSPALGLLGSRAVVTGGSPRRPIASALTNVWHFAQQHTRSLAVIGTLACLIVGWGATRLEVETDFTKNFRRSTELVTAYRFVEDDFGGAGVWDLMVPLEGRPTRDSLLRVLRMERDLEAMAPELNKATSLADAVDAAVGGLEQVRFELPGARRRRGHA